MYIIEFDFFRAVRIVSFACTCISQISTW